jgi:AcrR family transcriptional regulator
VTDRLTRSDARYNRERILEVARGTFADEGLDVPMREIARRADVGPATLYRHFPTKEALVTEAFREQMASCTSIIDDALADPDPWRAFCRAIERVFEMHALDRGFTAAFVSAFPRAVDFGAARGRAFRAFGVVAARAQKAGKLRADFVLDDLVLIMMANGGIRATSPAAAVAASRRFAALAIQSFRVQPEAPPLPPTVRLPLTVA